jgi:hypothetical protein
MNLAGAFGIDAVAVGEERRPHFTAVGLSERDFERGACGVRSEAVVTNKVYA